MSKPSQRCDETCWIRKRVWEIDSELGESADEDLVVHPNSHPKSSGTSSSSIYAAIRPWQIRLLRILPGSASEPLRCELFVATLLSSGAVIESLDQMVEYEALSYSWGTQTEPVEIECGGHAICVSSALLITLMYLRTDSPRYLWVDAICINQADDSEKSVQVPKMARIYLGARRVVAWLGQLKECGGKPLSILFSKGLTPDLLHREECKPGLLEICEALVKLAARPWFRRTWIRQELFASRSVTMRVGRLDVTWEHLQKLLLDSIKVLVQVGTWPVDASSGPRYLQNIEILKRCPPSDIAQLVYENRSHLESNVFWLLEKSLRGSVHFEVSDPRDAIYGLISMSSTSTHGGLSHDRLLGKDSPSHAVLKVDYSRTVPEVFADTTTYLINLHRSLDVILLGPVYRKEDSLAISERLPSWSPDWTMIPFETYLDELWDHVESYEGHYRKTRNKEGYRYELGSILSSSLSSERGKFAGFAERQQSVSNGELHCKGRVLGYVGEPGPPLSPDPNDDSQKATMWNRGFEGDDDPETRIKTRTLLRIVRSLSIGRSDTYMSYYFSYFPEALYQMLRITLKDRLKYIGVKLDLPTDPAEYSEPDDWWARRMGEMARGSTYPPPADRTDGLKVLLNCQDSLVLIETMVGDVVVRLRGCVLPVVLRPVPVNSSNAERTFRLIGPVLSCAWIQFFQLYEHLKDEISELLPDDSQDEVFILV